MQIVLLPLALTAALFSRPAFGDGPQENQRPVAPTVSALAAATESLADAPLEAHRRELLDLAFEGASAVPVNPQIKNRSKVQEWVVEAALELDQFQRAAQYTAGIVNWRRGAALASLAVELLESGAEGDVEPLLREALAVAEGAEDAADQEWRRGRILALSAEAFRRRGELGRAEALEAGARPADIVNLIALRAAAVEPEAVHGELQALEAAAASGDFDTVRYASLLGAELQRRFYGDLELRDELETKVRVWSANAPIERQIETLVALFEGALANGDRGRATHFLDEAQVLRGSASWLPEDGVRWLAELAILRHRAGAGAQARVELESADALFETARDSIEPMWRARALRPLARAWAAVGEPQRALAVFAQAFAEGAINPNIKPRSEDFVANCCALARAGLEPDQALWTSVRAVHQSLVGDS
jgi:hypothetical protein